MNGVIEIAGSALSAQQRALGVVANNVTNVNTNGFKRSSVRYEDIAARQADLPGTRGGGVTVSISDDLFSQGQLEQTGRAMDLSIDGAGLIELMGPGGQVLLWRGGTLSVSADGYLSSSEGLPLLAGIRIEPGTTDLRIGRDGTVSGQLMGDSEPRVLGTIQLVQISSVEQVERLDGGLYRLVDGGVPPRTVLPGEEGAGILVQGALERSNVDLNEEMVRLLIIQRAYSASAQLIQAADQFATITNGLRRS